MAWGEVNVVDQRKSFIHEILAGELSMAEICRRYEISPKNGYKWLNRYNEEGIDGLIDRSRAPLRQALKTDPEKERCVLKVRYEYPSWGPKKVQAWLKAHYPDIDWPSTTTMGNLFDREGLIVPRKYRLRVPARTVPLAHCHRPNDVWCTDFKGYFLTQDKSKCEPFTLTDGATRFLLRCVRLSGNDVDHVWAVLDTAFREYGLPLFLRNDNGPPFASAGAGRLSRLSVKLIKAGVVPEWIDPGKPHQNGRHERMHLTLKNEVANFPETTLDMQSKRLKEWVEYFNYIRPHEALGQVTPASVFTRSSRVWSGRLRSPEYPDHYDVRKVKSCGKVSWKGKEIWLANVLIGEPVGLEETEDGTYRVHYGPIWLGTVDQNRGFHRPEQKKRCRKPQRRTKEAVHLRS